MATTDAESKRAARRKARILKNPEERINRILGQTETSNEVSKNDDPHNKVIENISSNSLPHIESKSCENDKKSLFECIKDSPIIPELRRDNIQDSRTKVYGFNPDSHQIVNTENRVSSSKETISRVAIIWMILGVITRLLLGSKHGWIIGNSAIATFAIAYITIVALKRNVFAVPETQYANNATSQLPLIEMALRLCGLPSHIINTLLSVKGTIEALVNAFSLFFVPFVAVHLLALAFNLENTNEDLNN